MTPTIILNNPAYTAKAALLTHVICATHFALINDYYLNNDPRCTQSFIGYFVSQGHHIVVKKLNLQLAMCCKWICLHFRADPVDGAGLFLLKVSIYRHDYTV